MPHFYCLLGNTPQLSLLELTSLVEGSVSLVSPAVAQIELSDESAAQALMEKSGGIVKICQAVKELSSSDPQQIESEIAAYLKSTGQAKVTFGVAEIGRDHQQPISFPAIKHQLTDKGISVRYVESPRSGLSASVLLHHQDVIELVILPVAKTWVLAKTVAVQDIDHWTERDRGKPYADRRKGMLPPKVARIMVNLALGALTPAETAPRIYDPFCGTGTVLIEAVMRDCQDVVGSDLDSDSIAGTSKNLEWLAEVTGRSINATLFTSDVSQVSLDRVGQSIDAIVTEPFLGKPKPRPEQLPGIFKGLEKLYLGAFKQWRKILADEAVVVMVFPYVQDGPRTYSLEKFIDKLSDLGYTISSQPVLYHRPQATVQRQIAILKYRKQ